MANPTGEAIQTDSPIYTVAESNGLARLTIRMTYRNTTGKPVYLPMCQGPQPPRLQKQVGDQWVVAFAPNVLACEETPMLIANNQSYDYTFQVVAGMPGTNYLPRFSVSEIPGTYRVLWEIFHGAAGEPSHPVITRDPLPVEKEVSNTFQLVR
jgi:hypothetical protein